MLMKENPKYGKSSWPKLNVEERLDKRKNTWMKKNMLSG